MNTSNKELKIQRLQSRIALMKSRAGAENGKIIKKCERRIRNLKTK